MKNYSVRWTAFIAILSICFVVALMLTPIVAQTDFGQETIDAAVGAYFTQTADAYEDLVASATARPEYNATQTVISAFQATVTSQLQDNVMKTVEAQATTMITTAESVAADLSITPFTIDDIDRLSEIYFLQTKSPITDAEFSPSSRWLAVGYETGEIGIWDTQTGEPVQGLFGHENPISALMFSPDERILASASKPYFGDDDIVVSNVRIWDVQTGQQLHLFYESAYEVPLMVFSNDGLRLVTVSENNKGDVWNTLTGEHLYRLDNDVLTYVVAVAYNSTYEHVVIFDDNGDMYLYRLPDTEVIPLQAGNPDIAGQLPDYRMDVREQGIFYNRHGSLLYNVNLIRGIDSDRRIATNGRLLSIDESNTMLAIAGDTGIQIFGLLTGERAEVAATATASAESIIIATAMQIRQDSTATAQVLTTSEAATSQAQSTSIAATFDAAELDDCPGILVGSEGEILRIGRMEPALDSPVIGAVRAGTEVEIISRVKNNDGSWYEINQASRRVGYVEAEYVIMQCE
jgi:hypothetical protein